MSSEALRAKLFSERPDLREVDDVPGFGADSFSGQMEDVDEKDLSLGAWSGKLQKGIAMKVDKKEVLSEDTIREMFSPRPLAPKGDSNATSFGIVRAVKKQAFNSDVENEAKDFLVDEHDGLIGSQG
jgi:hypothetical protein